MPFILLVDDDPILRTSLRRILTRGNVHTVVEASNGIEAVRACQERVPDLVITDLIMPEKEGLETIIELRKTYPGIKLIAMSGGGRLNANDYLQAAKRMGAHKTLAKPFGADILMEAVDQVLGPPPPART